MLIGRPTSEVGPAQRFVLTYYVKSRDGNKRLTISFYCRCYYHFYCLKALLRYIYFFQNILTPSGDMHPLDKYPPTLSNLSNFSKSEDILMPLVKKNQKNYYYK